MGGKASCSIHEFSNSMRETGLVEVPMMGRVSVMDEGEEMEVDDIARHSVELRVMMMVARRRGN